MWKGHEYKFQTKLEKKRKPRILKEQKFAKARQKKKKPEIQNHKNLGKMECHKLIFQIERNQEIRPI